MKGVVLAVALLAFEARAQGAGSEATLVLVLGPPILVTLALDVTLLVGLVSDGTASRSRAVSTMVFATLAAALSFACLAIGASSSGTTSTWTAVSGTAAALGVGSMAIGIYGSAMPEPEPPPEPERAPRLRRQKTDSLPPEVPPQL